MDFSTFFERFAHLPPTERITGKLTWMERLFMGTAGLVLGGLLITASLLSPDPQGLGTHQQLGLPPCSSRYLLGIRCPACGMTTSWAYVMDGNLFSALQVNTAGTLLALLAIPASPWLVVSAVRGRVLAKAPSEMLCIWLAIAITILTLTDWGVRLYLFGG